MRPRTVPGDPGGDVAAARAGRSGHASHSDLRTQSGFEPSRESPGAEAAAAHPADRRSRDGRLVQPELGVAPAGDRLELRTRRPGQYDGPLDLRDGLPETAGAG